MSSSASASTSSPIPNFARGVVAILELWPALRLAVTEEWGGPDSASKRTWMASEIVDYIEGYMPAPAQGGADAAELDNVADEDDLSEMLYNMMSDEFDTDLEDDSPEQVAKNIVKLWKEVIKSDTTMLTQLETMVKSRAGKKVQAQRSGEDDGDVDEDGNPVAHEDDGDEDWESGDDDEDEDMEAVDRVKAPKLVPVEPVVDEEGFTLVQGKGKKGR